jgi:hypothetical protein
VSRSGGYVFDSPTAKKIVDVLEGQSNDDLFQIAKNCLELLHAEKCLAMLEECCESAPQTEIIEIEETYPL